MLIKSKSPMIRTTSECSGNEVRGEELQWHFEVTGNRT